MLTRINLYSEGHTVVEFNGAQLTQLTLDGNDKVVARKKLRSTDEGSIWYDRAHAEVMELKQKLDYAIIRLIKLDEGWMQFGFRYNYGHADEPWEEALFMAPNAKEARKMFDEQYQGAQNVLMISYENTYN